MNIPSEKILKKHSISMYFLIMWTLESDLINLVVRDVNNNYIYIYIVRERDYFLLEYKHNSIWSNE